MEQEPEWKTVAKQTGSELLSLVRFGVWSMIIIFTLFILWAIIFV